MKKLVLTLLLLLGLCVPSWAIDQGVCGKTFMFFYSEVNYILKFSNPVEDLPCTSGTATLYWYDKNASYAFSIDSNGFIKVPDVGVMAYYAGRLYFIDTAIVIFDEM